ncbi:proline--tRNA ligase [Chloroflexota bacterium]
MRISELFGKTQREIPADADTISHQLLLKAGMIQQIASGVYAYLPLAWKSIRKIENIIREEMNRAGGQEIMMPALQPLELWQETGRDQAFGKNLFSFTDRRDRQLVLGPTHEEVAARIASYAIQSYRDLPAMVYHIQTKFRDELRPRAGLIRVREFTMKDLYSFDINEDGLDISYNKMIRAYQNIYARCGLPALLIEADSGAIGGKDSNEFMVINESGEDEVIYCPECKYAANSEKAQSVKGKTENSEPLPIEEVSTPGTITIEQVAAYLKIPQSQTMKAVFYSADEEFVFIVLRGDIDVNETKLKNVLNCNELRLATEAEASASGITAGFASPVGLSGIKIIADDSITSATNLVAGANKLDTHLKNVNYPRDFKADTVTDIALARSGDNCPKCGSKLISEPGIEVGHIFKLGTSLSKKLRAIFVDASGASQAIFMGSYGIGVGRLLAALIEHSHDDKGIIWPTSVAPYQVHLCPLYRDNSDVAETAENIYSELKNQDLEVLFDDRDESPGIKFNDADLLGVPLRITVSQRTLEKNSAEIKWRTEKEAELMPLKGLSGKIKELINTCLAELSNPD